MPILLLLILALASGLLIAFAFDRLAPAKGATAAAADVIEHVAETSSLRMWWRARTDPAMATGLALTAAVALLIGSGAVIGVLALLTRGNATLASIDSSAAQWGADHATPFSTRLLERVSLLGDWPAIALILAVLAYELRRVPARHVVLFMLAVYIGNKLVTNGIKEVVDRARPTLNPIAETLGPAFPSGHSSTAASTYAALALILARRRSPRVRALLAGAAGGIAVGVAASRVLQDLHWFSDVVAGLILGWTWFALCAIAFGGRRLRFAEPMEKAAAEAPPDAAATPAARGSAHAEV
jgi:undecaprenyl-diphosphatase